MIEARELRLNNWVNIKGVPTQIESIHNEKGVNVWSETAWDMSVIEGENDLEPIPLTHTILEKCGFVSTDIKGELQLDLDEAVCLVGNPYMFNIAVYKLQLAVWGNWVRNKINYLHQLQNLYFTLTGEELTVNL